MNKAQGTRLRSRPFRRMGLWQGEMWRKVSFYERIRRYFGVAVQESV